MPELALQRCLNHHQREAVARCPECRHFYCRECVTEHAERLICASCLRRSNAPARRRSGLAWTWVLAWTWWLARAGVGLLLAWFFFYVLGENLLRLPSAFHEGTVWQVNWWENP